jgi:hypothetical protein
MAGPDRIEESRRYVFGEDERSYGIWDKSGGDEPLERFPVTDEGFDAGFTRFLELTGMERRMRAQVPRALLVVVLAGAALWLAAGVTVAVFAGGLAEPEEGLQTIFGVSHVVDALGYRLAIGALFLLAALALLRRERRTRPVGDAAEESVLPVAGASTASPGLWEDVLRWSVLVGMAVWIVSAVGTGLLFPLRGGLFGLGTPGTAFLVAQLVEILAFRLWVVALVLLLLRWARPWLAGREGSPASPERPPT